MQAFPTTSGTQLRELRKRSGPRIAFTSLALGFALIRCASVDNPLLVVDAGDNDSPVQALAFSNGGKLHSGGDDKVVRVCDVGVSWLFDAGLTPDVYFMAASRDDIEGRSCCRI